MAKQEVKERGTRERKKLSNKECQKALLPLHVELVKLQEWAVQSGQRICIVFEGRDGAGRSGTIKAITEPGSLNNELESRTALPERLPDISRGQPVDLLMRRPNLITARERLLASTEQSDAARLNYWPTVSLSALLARNG